MTDLAAHVPMPSSTAHETAMERRRVRRSAQMHVFTAALSVSLAVGLTVPSSEIRAKAFRLGLVAKTFRTQHSF